MDKYFYGLAASEVAEGMVDANLYVKAMAVAQGDERKGRAIYVSLRAEELSAEAKSRKIGEIAAAAAQGARRVVKGSAKSVVAASDGVEKFVRYMVVGAVVVAGALLFAIGIFFVITYFLAEPKAEQQASASTSTQVEFADQSSAMYSGGKPISEVLDSTLLERDKEVAKVFSEYRELRGYKALAIARDASGATTGGWSFEMASQVDADAAALASCEENIKSAQVNSSCQLFARGYKVIVD